ncbi:MAG: RDD family protein [Proteobacteria bacterium]|nr:RDD family protein [Pseudomonadota bacterium]MDA1332063.1 RDD family protein [Pseudomonadota bacterium]
MFRSPKTQDNRIQTPSRGRQLGSLGYECITSVALTFTIGFITTAILGSIHLILLRAIIGTAILLGVSAYYMLCWTTSGQSLAQKSWGLKLMSGTGATITVASAAKRMVLSIIFNVSLIGPALLLVAKDAQLPQDKILGTLIVVTDKEKYCLS